MKHTIIIAILLLLCSCGGSSEKSEKHHRIGKFVYVDRYNTIHIDRECVAIVGDNLKTKEERIMSRRGVQFVDTCDLTSCGDYGDKHGFCPRCINDKAYRRLSDMIDRNEWLRKMERPLD